MTLKISTVNRHVANRSTDTLLSLTQHYCMIMHTDLLVNSQPTSSEFLTRHTTPPQSLRASISPPPSRIRKTLSQSTKSPAVRDSGSAKRSENPIPSLAAVEAGEAQIFNHLEHFSSHISSCAQSFAPLSIRAFEDLYKRNQHTHGRHWVIHQHDHPVAGVHYDLRLQINETSSISWAIMYGLPGNCNSRRLNRNATETRVHNVWVCGLKGAVSTD